MELNREQIYKLVDVEDVKKFIIGGKAFLTLQESKKTGRWFTFKINKAKKDDENSLFLYLFLQEATMKTPILIWVQFSKIMINLILD